MNKKMKTKELLKFKIASLAELTQNWDSYNAEEITQLSILNASEYLDTLEVDWNIVNVFPMRDGGVQIEIGDFKEIEIFNNSIKEITLDTNYNIIKTYIYS